MKKFLKQPVFWLAILLVVYLVTRLIHLTVLPIFTDEAIYIRWAQIGGRDASWRFISLTDGKQPLFTWAVMASLRLFSDPLYAGRCVSVVAGFFSLIGMYVCVHELFRSRLTGLCAAFLYLISPFALFYDRLALYDSLVSCFFIWNLYLAVLLVRKLRFDISLLFGMALGIGMLNKTSAFFSLYLLPATLILFDWKKQTMIHRLFKLFGLVVVSAFLSQAIYSILRLSPYFYIIAQKDTIFVYPFSEWITHPFRFFSGNWHGMMDWLIGYMTWPIFLCVPISFFIRKKNFREKFLLIVWWLLPFAALALFGRILYPRHILFMSMPLYMLTAYTLAEIVIRMNRRWFAYVICGAIVAYSCFISFGIVRDIKTSAIPKSDRNQYLFDWPSGWGVPEIVTFLKEESANGELAVYTEGTFGLMPYALEIYLADNQNIVISSLWPIPGIMPKEIVESARLKPTYFVMYQGSVPPFQWRLELLSEYVKGEGNSSMRLYQVKP